MQCQHGIYCDACGRLILPVIHEKMVVVAVPGWMALHAHTDCAEALKEVQIDLAMGIWQNLVREVRAAHGDTVAADLLAKAGEVVARQHVEDLNAKIEKLNRKRAATATA